LRANKFILLFLGHILFIPSLQAQVWYGSDPQQCVSVYESAARLAARNGDSKKISLYKKAAADTVLLYSKETGFSTNEIRYQASKWDESMWLSAVLHTAVFERSIAYCNISMDYAKKYYEKRDKR